MWRTYLFFAVLMVLLLLTAFGAATLYSLAGLKPWAAWIMGVFTVFGLSDVLNRIDEEDEDA